MVVEEEHARELPGGGEVGEVDGRAAAVGDGDEGAEGRVELRQRGEVRRGGGVAVPRVHRRRLRAVAPPLPPAAHIGVEVERRPPAKHGGAGGADVYVGGPTRGGRALDFSWAFLPARP